jgi:hypothetical protein
MNKYRWNRESITYYCSLCHIMTDHGESSLRSKVQFKPTCTSPQIRMIQYLRNILLDSGCTRFWYLMIVILIRRWFLPLLTDGGLRYRHFIYQFKRRQSHWRMSAASKDHRWRVRITYYELNFNYIYLWKYYVLS